VEIHNRKAAAIDLGGWTLRDALDAHIFTMPAGTRLAGGGYLVLCSDAAAFTHLYPAVANHLGSLGFSLGGDGETIRLVNASGIEVDTVTYGDSAPWPEEADGNGATLALKNPMFENSAARNWAASLDGGTPGAMNDVFEPSVAECGAEEASFLRGDCDADGDISISDPVRLLFANFGSAPFPCRAACDANGDGGTGGVSDAVYTLRFLFRSGPPPVPPFPACGAPTLATDPGLGCETPPESCR
jgi:hypothetical protein